MILNVFKTQQKAQMQNEFNANNFIEHQNISLNKNAICEKKKEKGIKNKSQEIPNIKSNKYFDFFEQSPGFHFCREKYCSIPTVSTSIFKITLSKKESIITQFYVIISRFYIVLVTAFIKIYILMVRQNIHLGD